VHVADNDPLVFEGYSVRSAMQEILSDICDLGMDGADTRFSSGPLGKRKLSLVARRHALPVYLCCHR
jgi:hypothetical protein